MLLSYAIKTVKKTSGSVTLYFPVGRLSDTLENGWKSSKRVKTERNFTPKSNVIQQQE